MIRYFIHNPVATTVLSISMLLFGVLALISIPIQLTPNVQTPQITVTTIFPGATPADVEQDIITEQERFLRGIVGLRNMTSTARFGRAEIILDFDVATDMSENLVRVNNALSQVPSYPENVDEPSLSTSSVNDQPVAWFSVRAANGKELEVDVRDRFDLVEDFVKTRFERIPGVSGVFGVFGAASEEMRVYLDPFRLAEKGITIFEVRDAIRSNNRDVSGGELNEGKRRYAVRTEGRFRGPEDVERLIIKVSDDTPIYLRDVGYATTGRGRDRSLIRHNGRTALAFGVRHQPGTNLLEVMDEVRRVAADLNEGLLAENDLQILQITDDTEYVDQAVALVRSNLITGTFLALLGLLVFLRHLPSTFVVGLAIPLCIIGAMFLISLGGLSINVISLSGLAFSIGAVLDCSIVVLENIFRHRGLGKDSFTAAYDGVTEVWTAILASVMTNVIVFAPILTLREEAGQLFRDLAAAIVSANVLALLVSILVIPCLSARLLRKMPGHPRTAIFRKAYGLFGVAALAAKAHAGIGRILRFLLASTVAKLTVVTSTIAIVAGLTWLFAPQTEYLPEGNTNTIFGLLITPQGYNVAEMNSIGRNLEQEIRPYVEGTVEQYLAGELDFPPLNDFFFVSFDGLAFVFTSARRGEDATAVLGLLQQQFGRVPGAIPIALQRSIFSGEITGARGVDLDVTGPDIIMNTVSAFQIFQAIMSHPELGGRAQVRPVPGVEIGQPQLTIRPNWERAAKAGISAEAIGYGAWVLGDGAFADSFYRDGKKFDLYLYSTLGAFDTLSNFDNIQVAISDNDATALSSIADFDFEFVVPEIRRVNQLRATTLQISPPRDMSLQRMLEILDSIIADLRADGSLPPSVNVGVGGSSDKLNAMIEALKGNFILAICLVYLVLVLIFRHYGYPFIILLSIPVGISGGVLGLALISAYLGWATGGEVVQNLDVLTMLGFIILLGSVVNNPILVVQQSLNFMKEGESVDEGIVEGTLSRIRPLMMTTGTTMIGLLPLVLRPGAGSELYRGLSVVMFGGLFMGSIVTIFFMPCLMSLLFNFTDWVKKRFADLKESKIVKKLTLEEPEPTK